MVGRMSWSPQSMCSKLAAWIVVVYVSSAIVRLILLADSNKRAYNHAPGPCRILQGVGNGSAGIEFVPDFGIAFITNGLSSAFTGKGIGRILMYDFKREEQSGQIHEGRLVHIEPSADFDPNKFSPYGLSSFVSKKRISLYVVNAHPERRCVEIFVYQNDKKTLVHRKSICDSRLTSPVDIAVVGADRFFVTNLAYFSRGYAQYAELAMQSSFGSLLYYDGKTLKYSERFLQSPSGIFYDKERQRLIISSLLNEVLRIYDISRDLTIRHKIDISLLSSPNGVFVEPTTGDLIVALHPVLYSAFMHWLDPLNDKFKSPSQILRIRMQEGGTSWVITEPYANDGATISASSDVIYHNDQLLIGSLFGRCLLCDVQNPKIM